MINTVACGLLGLLRALALWRFAERSAVDPACTAYDQRHGMTYGTSRSTEIIGPRAPHACSEQACGHIKDV